MSAIFGIPVGTPLRVDEIQNRLNGFGGGECDWDTMKNKPFYSTIETATGSAPTPSDTSIEFDGTWYHIIDTPITEEQLLQSTVTLSIGGTSVFENVRITEEMLMRDFAPIALVAMVVANNQPVPLLIAYMTGDFPINEITVSIPKVGIYFPGDADAWQTIDLTFTWWGVKTLDSIYLPMDAIDARIDAYIGTALGGDY